MDIIDGASPKQSLRVECHEFHIPPGCLVRLGGKTLQAPDLVRRNIKKALNGLALCCDRPDLVIYICMYVL